MAVHVTAYLEYNALNRIINSVVAQSLHPNLIRIVDNSPEPIQPTAPTPTLEFDHQPRNIGTAGAINSSIKEAIVRNFDYLWILDQDSEPEPTLLENLVRLHQKLTTRSSSPIGILAPMTRNRDDAKPNTPLWFDRYRMRKVQYGEDPVECDFLPASGMLLHIPCLKNIQLPSSSYFLDIYDFALGLAVQQAGASVWFAPTLELSHQVGRKITVQTVNGPRKLGDMPASRVKLVHRNSTFLLTRNTQGIDRLLAAAWQLRVAILQAGRFLRYDFDGKLSKAYAALAGWFLGLFCLGPQR